MSKLTTKWILNDAVNDLKVRLQNAGWLRGRNAANDGDINIIRVNGSDVIEFASVPEVGADASTDNGLVRKSQMDTALGLKLDASQKGAANGVATLDANQLIPIAQIPPAAIERLVIVADETARFALTTATVQNGDTVKQTDTNLMYFVKDDTNLDSAAGYEAYTAGAASTIAWSGVTGTPTTISGYGITDFNSTFDTQLGTKTTDNLTEGSTNLYYTTGRFDTAFSGKTTDGLTEGVTNLYFTTARAKSAAVADAINDGTLDVAPSQNAVFDALALKFNTSDFSTSFDSNLSGKTTDNLTEGSTNLYHTDGRAQTAAVVNSTAGSETVQAASVSAMKSYVGAQISAIPASASAQEEIITLVALDISNGYVDLAVAAINAASISVTPVGGVMQLKGTDYTVALTGGVGSVTRITFAGDLLELVATEKIVIRYEA